MYFDEMQRCEKTHCYWALLHVLLAMPDICGALENTTARSGDRYIAWCTQNMPSNPKVTPGDRYQMRNAVLHQGTTIADNSRVRKKPTHGTQYRVFSFVDPTRFDGPIHQTVSATGDILTINVAGLADDTRGALRKWFAFLQHDPVRLAAVVRNLPTLAHVKPKVAHLPVPGPSGHVITVTFSGFGTSSTRHPLTPLDTTAKPMRVSCVLAGTTCKDDKGPENRAFLTDRSNR